VPGARRSRMSLVPSYAGNGGKCGEGTFNDWVVLSLKWTSVGEGGKHVTTYLVIDRDGRSGDLLAGALTI
jgi:hypothetical protein